MDTTASAFDTCLPGPLRLLCRLDNRLGPHDDVRGLRCRLHGLALRLFWRWST